LTIAELIELLRKAADRWELLLYRADAADAAHASVMFQQYKAVCEALVLSLQSATMTDEQFDLFGNDLIRRLREDELPPEGI
jgi:hypothetical protein